MKLRWKVLYYYIDSKVKEISYILMENWKKIVSNATIRGSFGLKANIKMEN